MWCLFEVRHGAEKTYGNGRNTAAGRATTAALQQQEQIEWLTPKQEEPKSAAAPTDDSMTLARFSRIVRSSTPMTTRSSKVNADHAKSFTSKRNRSMIDEDEAKLGALSRAEELQANLDPKFPSFVKSMVPSHVASGYWMGLPAQFSNLHLPNTPTITLVDENGEEYTTKFIYEKTGLSAGWRKFSLDHGLVEGDALVFQLIEPTKLKVYILRAYSFAEVDGALGLLNLDSRAKQVDPDQHVKTTKRLARKYRRSLPLCVIQGNSWNPRKPTPAANLAVPPGQTGNDSDEVDSEVLQGIGLSGSIVEFNDLGDLESFTIKVNDFVIIDSEIPEFVRNKYYKLCCSRKALLHENILKGINCKLVAGIISEIVNIVDAITDSNLTTPRDAFATWDKSLIAFEQLGMNVGFLRSRLQRLVSLAFESDEAIDTKRYREALDGKDGIEAEIRATEAKLMELKEESNRFEAEIRTLKVKAENHEQNFQAEVNAPW